MLDAAIRDKGLVVITVHPAVTFVDPERTPILERLLTRAINSPDIDVTSGEDLVRTVSAPIDADTTRSRAAAVARA